MILFKNPSIIDHLKLIVFLIYVLSQINAFTVHNNHSALSTTNESSPIVSACDEKDCPINTRTGEVCSSHGNCDCINKSCTCLPGWVGSTCQYDAKMLSCENALLRDCIRCQVRTKGIGTCQKCEFFPKPVLAEKLIVKRKEKLCSFTDIDLDEINSTVVCKYFFKLANIPDASSLRLQNQNVDIDVYITAKSVHYCMLRNISNNNTFPHSSSMAEDVNSIKTIAKNQQLEAHIIQDEENTSKKSRANYETAIGVLVLAALPFISCFIGIIVIMRRFPCGLCNMFRRPSAIYLRNLRPYPGYPHYWQDIVPRDVNSSTSFDNP